MGNSIYGDSKYYQSKPILHEETYDVCDMSVPLLVNCVGYVVMTKKFITNTTRSDYYLQIMEKGELLCGEQRDTVLRAGQFIVRSPHKAYKYEMQSMDMEIGYYYAHFTGSFVETLLENCNIETDRTYTMADGFQKAFREDFSSLFREYTLCARGIQARRIL